MTIVERMRLQTFNGGYAVFVLAPVDYRAFVREWLAEQMAEPVPTIFDGTPIVVARFQRHSYAVTHDEPPNMVAL